jgi:hypothetical protein
MTIPLWALAMTLAAAVGVTSDRLDDILRVEGAARKACGPRAVWHCLRRFGVEAPFETVCEEAGLDDEGSSLDRLVDTLRKHDLPAQAIRESTDRILDLPVPAILIIENRHCIVYEGLEPGGEGKVRYYEPAKRMMKTAALDTLRREWSGQAIVFEPPPMTLVSFLLLACGAGVATILLAGLIGMAWRAWARSSGRGDS